ncbi:MAG: hypothetical protein LUD81_01390 [Clostridiales bacterium]|nr:hypothetical protein [Clostridiales bacterium]
MTIKEFALIAKNLKSAYSTNTNFLPTEDDIITWYDYLKDFDREVLQNAVYEYVSNNDFPPKISNLRAACVERTAVHIPTFDEAWKEASDLAHYFGIYHMQKAFENMSPLTYAVIKNLGWRDFCTSENETALRANFRDIYNSKREEIIKNQRMPENAYRNKQALQAERDFKNELNRRLKDKKADIDTPENNKEP